ncbi:MAG: hypothetical protein JJ913_06205 [Rhizobiaceae bacterium]|nr:hypothetical protein [Rhizobiaceae bacterium]
MVAAIAAFLTATSAHAACPIELATYADRDGVAELEFRPVIESVTVTNHFRMAMRGGPQFEGMVMWTDDPARPNGFLTFNCPEGDVTGAEIEACTLWQGVVYSVDAAGAVGLMPVEGEPAPQTLVLADLANWMRHAPAFGNAGLVTVPWDVFTLTGCQE